MTKIFKFTLIVTSLITAFMVLCFEMTSELKLILILSVMVSIVLISLDHKNKPCSK